MAEKLGHNEDSFENPADNQGSADQAPARKSEKLSDLQIEAEKQREKIGEARESAEKTKQLLSGLKYNPPKFSAEVEEFDAFFEEIKESRRPTPPPRKKLSKEDLEAYNILGLAPPKEEERKPQKEKKEFVEITPQRREELKARAISTYWARCKTWEEKEDLTDARFFSISELAQRRKESSDLLSKVSEELKTTKYINNRDELRMTLHRLADEYGFNMPELFSVNKETGEITLNDAIKQETIEEIRSKLKIYTEYSAKESKVMSTILRNSRIHIDPGILIVAKERKQLPRTLMKGRASGYYSSSSSLIVMPAVFHVGTLRHEFEHFEDYVYGRASKEDGIITEINSFLGELAYIQRLSKKEADAYFEAIKEIIRSGYSDKYEAQEELDIMGAIDATKRLYENGLSLEAIKSILMHSKNLKDILQWNDISEEEMKKLVVKSEKTEEK